MYAVVESLLDHYYYDGHECLLRAICEAQISSGENLLAKVIKRFLTPSYAIHADVRLHDYLAAEKYGKQIKYCKPFEAKCN